MIERAWAAGFFDGEGSTCTTVSGSSLQLTVPQVDLRPLARFVAAVGESPNAIHHTMPRGPISRRPIHVFRIYGDRAIEVLRRLWPFLSEPKQDQALHALTRYAFRSVSHRGGLTICARRHLLTVRGRYVAPDGSGECAECRRQRRSGSLPKPRRLTAIEAGIGVREYRPSPLIQT